ncbi:alanine--glyoxylate aminotransferase 2, mitochondrial isoform X4 [Pelodiscus sinensis]|uniref:alanine--glyoxylate aminotransferase 2, mitochondrial isoform X4 n=1 Tax=Pelodiscus sinensis TaxID=13735 RepID=UPI003F6B5700
MARALGRLGPLRAGGRRRHPGSDTLKQQELKNSFSMQAKMPPCDFSPEKYESYPYEHMLKIRKQNLSPALLTCYKKPLLLHQGHMQWLFDYEGRRYLDLFAGIVTVSVGHCHPKVTAAAQKQLGRLWHTSNIYMHPSIQEYVEKLTALLPDPLKTMLPDVFRGLWGGSHCRDSPVQTIRKCSCSQGCCEANDRYIEQFNDTLSTCVPKAIAGFIAEPIQGVNGAVQYPKRFLKEAFRLVRERGGVCVADEVQTGFGRTGSHFWGFQTHDVVPDIVTLAKGIGNGFPMAAVITTSEIANSLAQNLHFNTFGGNPMACVVGSAVLDAIAEDGLQKNSEEVGTYMLLEFAKLRDEFEIIGDVRGKGLMIGIEMVKNKDSCQPLPVEEMSQIWENCKDMGLLIGRGGLYNQTFRLKPPMCITKQDADFAVKVFHAALMRHLQETAI